MLQSIVAVGKTFTAGTDFRNNKRMERTEETLKGETAKLS
jgi:hypothetical protein